MVEAMKQIPQLSFDVYICNRCADVYVLVGTHTHIIHALNTFTN